MQASAQFEFGVCASGDDTVLAHQQDIPGAFKHPLIHGLDQVLQMPQLDIQTGDPEQFIALEQREGDRSHQLRGRGGFINIRIQQTALFVPLAALQPFGLGNTVGIQAGVLELLFGDSLQSEFTLGIATPVERYPATVIGSQIGGAHIVGVFGIQCIRQVDGIAGKNVLGMLHGRAHGLIDGSPQNFTTEQVFFGE